MKLLPILFFITLIWSCSSTKEIKNSKDFIDPRVQLNEGNVTSCLPVFNDIEFNTEIISYSFNTSKDTCFIEGKVYDLITKEPLIGADVTLLPCSINTYTNIDGHYKFEFQSNECDFIKIRYIGYVTNTIAIKKLTKY